MTIKYLLLNCCTYMLKLFKTIILTKIRFFYNIFSVNLLFIHDQQQHAYVRKYEERASTCLMPF